MNVSKIWGGHLTPSGSFGMEWPQNLICLFFFFLTNLSSIQALSFKNVCCLSPTILRCAVGISGVASPICQEGQSEKKNIPFLCLFFPISLFFPDFLPLFPDFWHFFLLSRGHSAPLDPPVAMPLVGVHFVHSLSLSFLPDFLSFFLIFSLFFLIFGIFFLLSRGHSAPLDPPVAMSLVGVHFVSV